MTGAHRGRWVHIVGHASDMNSSERQDEADLLAQIGRHLFGQELRIRVELPTALATGAVAAWERIDSGDTNAETLAARTLRQEAGALALIGLAVDERGATGTVDQVEVELDAWQIGMALDAADRRGLLTEVDPLDWHA